MDAYQILVIILSITLAIFLALGIAVLILVIKLVNQIRHITAKAEALAEDVEAVGSFFRKTATPVVITNLVSNIITMFHKNKEK